MRTLILASLAATSLSGCLVLSSSPIIDAANVLGTTISGVASMTPNPPQNPIVYSKAAIRDICIEWNGAVALSDFVPSLQSELMRHGVQSRVYDAGTQAIACPVTLSYMGYVKWDTKVFNNAYQPYLTYATLTLRREGRVMGSAQYRIGSMGQDKWSNTSEKLAPLVDALLPGNPAPLVEKTGPVQNVASGF
ncbi:cell division protein FtsI [Herbaspirillum lusitanum]|jgi:hypothetical protein|uniref:Cell division protein FtsI n=1 Tax=Herbaspirillum lusitanum TaxID=213312 RepID=A0ABW9AGA1_9BURK